MTLEEAIHFIKGHQSTFDADGKRLIALRYVRRRNGIEFGIYDLTYLIDEEGDWFAVQFNGGTVPESIDTEDAYCAASYEELREDYDEEQLPPDLNFQVYTAKDPSGLIMSYALKEIFPDLPDPELWDIEPVLRQNAIEKIDRINQKPASAN